MKSSSYKEADAYQSPTRLFTLINNGEPPISVIQHAFNFPEEVGTWIVSRKQSKEASQSPGKNVSHNTNENNIMWKYLPIHLACLRQNPNKEMLLVMRDVFPNGLKMRDYQGNLPIHYLLHEGCGDEEILDIVADEDYACLHKKDGEGRQMLDIISQSTASDNYKKVMKRWVKKRDTDSSVLSPRRKSPAKYNHHSQSIAIDNCHHNFQNELLVAQKELNGLFQAIEKLEWECDAKDQTIDSLSAQLMSFEKKMREGDNSHTEAMADNKQKDLMSVRNGYEDDVVQSMKEKMAIDANIVSSQEDTVKHLKSELELLTRGKMKSSEKNESLQKQVDLFEGKILQHDDAVAHVRKVSNILQDDLKSKEKDIVDLEEKLVCAHMENEELNQKIVAKEREAEKKLVGFQDNIREQSETLSDLLKTLKGKEEENGTRLSGEVRLIKDQLAVKDKNILSLERELEAVNAENSELANELAEKERAMNAKIQNIEHDVKRSDMLALEKQLEEALARNSDLANILAEKEREINSTLQSRQQNMRMEGQPVDSMTSFGSESDGSSRHRNNSVAVIAAARNYLDGPDNANDIREKQTQLQSELRDIYAQINAVMPGLKVDANLQTVESGNISFEESKEAWKENNSSDVAIRRQLWEERRPWRVEAEATKDESDVYNVEDWGKRSQRSGNSVYNM